MEDKICTRDCSSAGLQVADVSDEEFDFMCDVWEFGLVLVTHIVLLLLVAREDANLFDVGAQEALEDCVSETTSASTNQ